MQAVASCGGYLANLCCGGCFDRECGVKATVFLRLVAKNRENPAVGAKNDGRCLRYAGGRRIQRILNGSHSVHKISVAKSRLPLKPVVA